MPPSPPVGPVAATGYRRRPAAALHTAGLYLLAALLMVALALVTAAFSGRLSVAGFIDPDSWTRAVLLRHAIETGDFAQKLFRDASGSGTSIHWSRLLEAVALPFVLALRPFLGLDRAVLAVGAMVGPVSLGCLAAALCWAARPFVGWPPALLFILPATALTPVFANYGSLGVFGHHLAIAACLVMMFGHVARACRRAEAGRGDAVGTGVWYGVGVWFSVEAAPFAAIAFGSLALAWIIDGGAVAFRRLQLAALAALTVVAFAWLVDRPSGGTFAIEVDRLSWPFVVMLALYLAAVTALPHFGAPTAPRRALAFLVAGIVFGGAWLWLFPQFTLGLRQFMSPQVEALVWNNIAEMRGAATPIAAAKWNFGGMVAVATLAAAAVAARHDRCRLMLLGFAAVAAGGLLWLGIAHLRFSAYGDCLGAVAIAVIASWFGARRGLVPASLVAAVLLLFVPLLARADRMLSVNAGPGRLAPACPIEEAARWLQGESGVVFANLNDSPELLWRSRVETVASLYQRAGAAEATWLAAVRAVGDRDAAAALTRARVDFVLLCAPTKGERPPYLLDLPETALERWQRGDLPPWLRRVRDDRRRGLSLLRKLGRTATPARRDAGGDDRGRQRGGGGTHRPGEMSLREVAARKE